MRKREASTRFKGRRFRAHADTRVAHVLVWEKHASPVTKVPRALEKSYGAIGKPASVKSTWT